MDVSRTLTMTSVLPDPAGIAEARILGGNPHHNGELWFIGLPYMMCRLGTTHAERWGGGIGLGRRLGQPELIPEFSV